jgi:uncharacterized membrane protein
MGDVCFSGSALTLLGAMWLVIQAAIVALFWVAVRAFQDSIRDARSERDRASSNLEEALHIGTEAVGTVSSGRRAR